MDQLERARLHLSQRAAAYRAVFLAQRVRPRPWWAFWRDRQPVQLSVGGDTVLRDLARYCYAHKSTLVVSRTDQHVDPLAMAYAEGRRDVYLRIAAQLDLDAAEIDHIVRMRDSDG